MNARKNVPSVQGAGTHPPNSRRVRPAGKQRAVIDAVSPEQHREDQRHHLAPRVRCARPVPTQVHQSARQRLDPQPLGERRDQHHACVRDRSLIIELDPQTIQPDPLIMHREGDLLSAGPGCANQPLNPAQEVILLSDSDRTALPPRLR